MAGRNILLVEGPDDEHVIKHLCGNRSGPILEVKQHGGIDRLLETLHLRLREANGDGDTVGVVVDADTDLSARWQSLRSRLIHAGYQGIPQIPNPGGAIVEPPADPHSLLPQVGVWIMPDNRTTGILEDFLRLLVPENSRLFAHVEASVRSIPAGERRFSAVAEPKALIHTWLAWQQEPGKPLGTAITAGFLDADAPEVTELVTWLNRLFRS
jgi:hypothetical protein